MMFEKPLPERDPLRRAIDAHYRADETACARALVDRLDDVAPKVLDMLAGAMDELIVGDPGLLATDVGPVIDDEASRCWKGTSSACSARAG